MLRRVRIADGEPVALESAVFPADRAVLLLGGDLERDSLHAALVAAGVVPTAGRGALSAEAADPRGRAAPGHQARPAAASSERRTRSTARTVSRSNGPRAAYDRATHGSRRRLRRRVGDQLVIGAEADDDARAHGARAGVVGTGFIGVVHVEALRRLGVDVAGVVGSSPERAERQADRAGLRQLRGAARGRARRRRPPHDPEPPPLPAGEAGARGRQARRLREAARADRRAVGRARSAGRAERARPLHELQHPLLPAWCSRRVRSLAAATLGEIWNVHGGYLQDWLLRPTPTGTGGSSRSKGGDLRAVGDIGSHWLDLAQFVTGLRVESVFADLATTIPVRRRPTGRGRNLRRGRRTSSACDAPMATEDFAHLLLRFRGGARGSAVVSQVSAGRKNSLRFEVDGSRDAARLGLRAARGAVARPPRRAERAPAPQPGAARRRGPRDDVAPRRARRGLRRHVQGALSRCLPAVAAGGPPDEPDYPTFRDGHVENVLGEAIAQRSRMSSAGWR